MAIYRLICKCGMVTPENSVYDDVKGLKKGFIWRCDACGKMGLYRNLDDNEDKPTKKEENEEKTERFIKENGNFQE